jgi:hypothetical protein
MKAVLSGIVIAFCVAVLASLVLGGTQRPSFEAYSTQAVRVGDPGHNLIGPAWDGSHEPAAEAGT